MEYASLVKLKRRAARRPEPFSPSTFPISPTPHSFPDKLRFESYLNNSASVHSSQFRRARCLFSRKSGTGPKDLCDAGSKKGVGEIMRKAERRGTGGTASNVVGCVPDFMPHDWRSENSTKSSSINLHRKAEDA